MRAVISNAGGAGVISGPGVARLAAGTLVGSGSGLVGGSKILGSGGLATIRVSNLHPMASSDDIKACFSEFGPVVKCELRLDAGGVSSGTAEISYSNRASALAAIEKYHDKVADGSVFNC